MTPQELYKAGELDQAIKALGEELRSNPVDAKRRTFLFELLCLAGQWDRAEKQIDVLADRDPKNGPGMLLYRSALYGERIRQEMFRTKSFPKKEHGVAAPAGELDGEPFTRLSDAESAIGDHLETFIAGDYVWIPTKFVERLEIEPPTTLRDLIWARARIQVSPAFRLQDLGEVLLPVIAPLSYTHPSNEVRMGRTSVWEQVDGEEVLFGRKLMNLDGEEVPLIDMRSIEWTSPAADNTEQVDAAS